VGECEVYCEPEPLSSRSRAEFAALFASLWWESRSSRRSLSATDSPSTARRIARADSSSSPRELIIYLFFFLGKEEREKKKKKKEEKRKEPNESADKMPLFLLSQHTTTQVFLFLKNLRSEVGEKRQKKHTGKKVPEKENKNERTLQVFLEGEDSRGARREVHHERVLTAIPVLRGGKEASAPVDAVVASKLG